MGKRKQQWVNIIGLVFLVIFFIAVSVLVGKYHVVQNPLTPISFKGDYQAADGEVRPWGEDRKVSSEKFQKITLTGSFDRDIPQNEEILFYIQYLEVHLFVSGEEVYKYGYEGSYPEIMHSGGMAWEGFKSAGISRDDEVMISLESKYANNYYYAYDEFMDSISVGDSGALLNKLFKKDILYAAGGVILFLAGMFSLFMTFVLRSVRYKATNENLILSFHLIISGVWIFQNGLYISLIFPYPLITQCINAVGVLLLAILLLLYLRCFVGTGLKKVLIVEADLMILMTIAVMAMQLTGIMDCFEAINYIAPIVIFCECGAMILVFISLFEKRTKKDRAILVSLAVYSILFIAEAINYYFEFVRVGEMMMMGLFIFLAIQVWRYIGETVDLIRDAQRAVRYEREISDSRIAVMLSQIQPHFLYNALNTIHHLCRTDPKLAADTVEKFAKFLRANMDSLEGNGLIDFEDEINHVRNYFAIEKLRFENIDIKYDLKTTTFDIPTLTIQPMVENAIKHGISIRSSGGTVTVRSREDEGCYIVEIIDDGVGFDQGKPPETGKSHVGILNTKKRIETMCGGTLDISSRPGEGTVVMIILPKDKALPERTGYENSLHRR